MKNILKTALLTTTLGLALHTQTASAQVVYCTSPRVGAAPGADTGRAH